MPDLMLLLTRDEAEWLAYEMGDVPPEARTIRQKAKALVGQADADLPAEWEAIRPILVSLRPRVAEALSRRYGFDAGWRPPFRDIGARMGVTGARASDLCRRGLRQLRHPTRARAVFAWYLGMENPPRGATALVGDTFGFDGRWYSAADLRTALRQAHPDWVVGEAKAGA